MKLRSANAEKQLHWKFIVIEKICIYTLDQKYFRYFWDMIRVKSCLTLNSSYLICREFIELTLKNFFFRLRSATFTSTWGSILIRSSVSMFLDAAYSLPAAPSMKSNISRGSRLRDSIRKSSRQWKRLDINFVVSQQVTWLVHMRQWT